MAWMTSHEWRNERRKREQRELLAEQQRAREAQARKRQEDAERFRFQAREQELQERIALLERGRDRAVATLRRDLIQRQRAMEAQQWQRLSENLARALNPPPPEPEPEEPFEGISLLDRLNCYTR